MNEFGKQEKVFAGLADPFYAVDSRDWQLVKPDHDKLKKAGSKILAIEKERPHVPFERAIMAIRFTNEIIGTQFHPEADPEGMKHYMLRQDKKDIIIRHHGADKYEEMLQHLNDPDTINLTQNIVFPNFLRIAIENIRFSSDKQPAKVTLPR